MPNPPFPMARGSSRRRALARYLSLLVLLLGPSWALIHNEIVSWDESVYAKNTAALLGRYTGTFDVHRPPMLSVLAMPFQHHEWIVIALAHVVVALIVFRYAAYRTGAFLLPMSFLLVFNDKYLVSCLEFMTEIPTAALLLVCWHLYRKRAYAGLGFAIGFGFLLRWNLAVLGPLFFILELARQVRTAGPRAARIRPFVSIAGGCLLVLLPYFLIAYFVYGNPLAQPLRYLAVNEGGVRATLSASGILFFPKVLTGYLVGWTMGTLLWLQAAFYLAPRIRSRLGDTGNAALAGELLFLIFGYTATLSLAPLTLVRLLVPLIPLIVLCTALFFDDLWRLTATTRTRRAWFTAGLAVFTVLAFVEGRTYYYENRTGELRPVRNVSAMRLARESSDDLPRIGRDPCFRKQIAADPSPVLYSDDWWLGLEAHFGKRVVRVGTPHTWSRNFEPKELVDLAAVPDGSLFLSRFFPRPPIRFQVVCMQRGVALLRIQAPTPGSGPPAPG